MLPYLETKKRLEAVNRCVAQANLLNNIDISTLKNDDYNTI